MTQNYNLDQIAKSAQYAAATARQALEYAQNSDAATKRSLAALLQNSNQLNQTLSQLAMQRTGGNPSLQYVENIPGRRVPFDLLVNIAIDGTLTSVTQGSITISQDGPFVAVSRFAAFISQYSFQYTNPDTSTSAIFSGRSFGRQRPIHSAWDLNDGQPHSEVLQTVAFPGAGQPHIVSPSNSASFRSMQPDFRIFMENAGFAFPRSNLEVPSSFYTKQINSPFALAALDVFERGETMTFKVQPLHPTNPSYGNVDAFTGPGSAWPFLASQFDAVEGISDPVLDDVETDPVTRLANGILVIGFHGYRIIQPPGVGQY